MGQLDYDKFGHCVVCSKNLLIQQVVENRVVTRYLPDYSETEVLLSDKSKMRICICKLCKQSFKQEDLPVVMDKVKKGWEREIEEDKTWSNEKKEAYLNRYNALDIVTVSEDVPDDILDIKHKEFKEEKIRIKEEKEAKNGASK